MNLPKRKRIRLPEYDYSQQGGYFITICTYGRLCLLSHISPGTECNRASVILTDLGRIADGVLNQLANQDGFRLDAYVIMPNHIHAVLIKEECVQEKQVTIGRFVGAFKSIVANRCCKACDRRGITAGKIWQRNYYDHILRNTEDHYEKIKYIDENPDKWQLDDLYKKQ